MKLQTKPADLLSDSFLDTYPEMPEHMNELSSFVFYRTYSRWLKDFNRRETWKEAVTRAVEYNMSLGIKELSKYKGLVHKQKANLKSEAETLFDNIFNLRQFLSGRTHWVGGADTGVADKFPLSNFNCAFLNITRLDGEQNDLADLFYALLVGTGVGFKCTKEMARNLPLLRNDIVVIHEPYNEVPDEEKESETNYVYIDDVAFVTVGDSKEGWVEALRIYFELMQDKYIKTISFNYNNIRLKGTRLKTFGGTASGYEPLRDMFAGFNKVVKNTLDPMSLLEETYPTGWMQLRPIHVLDMGNLIGNNVVVGGVRRTAEIFLCDEDDWECIFAKYGINGLWNPEHHLTVINKATEINVPQKWIDFLVHMPYYVKEARPLHHRRMSNNSIAFQSKPSKDFLEFIFLVMQGEGEPGFVNLEAANRRRPNCEGLNPCAEILLDSYGVCNLTTVNVDAFVLNNGDGYSLDFSGLMQAQALSARAGMRMTCVDLELPKWDEIQKRDRLIGTSLTGWKDALAKLNYNDEQEERLLEALQQNVRETSVAYAHILRIPTPLCDTTIKPEGSLSQVAGGVSSGLHMSHAPYYIRRIRINADDALVKVVKDLNWTVTPNVGEDVLNPKVVVIDFPVKSGANKTRADISIKEQFDTYFRFQDVYSAHNSSNTINVKPEEWQDCADIVYENWDNFVGVSFLAYDGGNYELAPYEEISKEQYEELKLKMKPFNYKLLEQYELNENTQDDTLLESCEGGACPIR